MFGTKRLIIGTITQNKKLRGKRLAAALDALNNPPGIKKKKV